MRRLLAAAILLGAAGGAGAVTQTNQDVIGKPYVELYTSGWAGLGRAETCNLRGNVVIIDLFNPNVPRYGYKFNRTVSKIRADLIKFKDVGNLTYILCTSDLTMEQVQRLFRENGITFCTGIDPTSVNKRAYGVAKLEARNWVILDHEGKVVFNNRAPSGTHPTELDQAVRVAPGVFGLPLPPASIRNVHQVIARGQFGAAQGLIAKARRTVVGRSEEGKAYLDKAEKGIKDFRAARIMEIENLAAGDGKWKAYKLAESFLRTFGHSGADIHRAKKVMRSLQSKQPVKNELAARNAFNITARLVRSALDRERADGMQALKFIVDNFDGTQGAARAKVLVDYGPQR